jgi:uncharacterized membrane protein YdjX (TVP38/TMEM64 family)
VVDSTHLMTGSTWLASPRPELRHLFGSRRILLLLLLVGLVALAMFAEGVRTPLLSVADTIQGVSTGHPVWAVVAALLFTALSAMLAFVSSAVIAPFMATTWGTTRAGLLLWTGWLLGGVLSYSIGRYLGRPVIQRLASPGLLARYEERLSHHTPFGLVLLFQLALPSEVPGYLLGLMRYRFLKYFASLALGELPYAVATIYLGAGVMERRVGLVIGVGAATVALSAWTYHLLHRRLAGVAASSGRLSDVG